jgi:hypothetical protein
MMTDRKFPVVFFASLWVLCGILSSAYGQSNILPSPFPLCPMNGQTPRIGRQVDGFYSYVNTDSYDRECMGFAVKGVNENPEVGKPSFHILLDGEVVQGKKSNSLTYTRESGYGLGASVAPSFVLTDRVQGFRPSLFFGADIRYQKMEVDYVFNNPSDFTQMGNLFSTAYSLKSEAVSGGLYAGGYFEFHFGHRSLSPFLMTRAATIRVNNDRSSYADETFTHSFFTQTAGFEFRLIDPGVSVLAMAQFVQEEDEEDVEAYSMMVGVSF